MHITSAPRKAKTLMRKANLGVRKNVKCRLQVLLLNNDGEHRGRGGSFTHRSEHNYTIPDVSEFLLQSIFESNG